MLFKRMCDLCTLIYYNDLRGYVKYVEIYARALMYFEHITSALPIMHMMHVWGCNYTVYARMMHPGVNIRPPKKTLVFFKWVWRMVVMVTNSFTSNLI